jgi:ABC-type sugar transport system permease subunit
MVLVMGVMGYSVVVALFSSFQKLDFMSRSTGFVGLANYSRLFTDPRFLNSLLRTMILAAGTVAFGMVMSLAAALLLNSVPRFRKTLNALALVPWLVSAVAVAMMFRFMFVGNAGLANLILQRVGLEPVWWFTHPGLTIVILIVAVTWYIAPLSTIVLVGGLQTIDRELYDSAALDGASKFRIFKDITLPLIRPMMRVSMIWLTFASFNQFDVVLPATGGGPGRATEVMALLMYRMAFDSLDFSSAYAITILLMIMNIAAGIGFSWLFRER